jgi:hypothetical protein
MDLEHGRLTTYVNDRCHCVPCTAASRDYGRARYRLRGYGLLPQLTPVDELATHLAWLSSHGIGWEQVATLTGVGRSTVSAILYPRTRRRGVTPRVAEQILAVLPTLDNAADAALIDAAGTQRRLGALMLQGHTLTAIQNELAVTALGRVLTRDRVTARVARQVRDYNERNWNRRPNPVTPREAAVIGRTIARAAAAGYLPAMAWDDDLIDDPTAAPAVDAVRRPPPAGRLVHLDDVEFLARHGATWEQVEARTGARRNSIEKSCGRANRHDLVARITSNRRVAA